MDQKYIFIVGKPDTRAGLQDIVHGLGYKLGILLDKNLSQKKTDKFDRVELVDFSELDSEIKRLDSLNLSVAGLLCTYENYILAKAKLGEHFSVPAISVDSAMLTTDKSLMRQAFLDADSTISPDFKEITTQDEALEFAKTHTYPLILKPANLVKSLLVIRCNSKTELIHNFAYVNGEISVLYKKYNFYEHKPKIIIEEFITGKQCSIAAFVDSNGKPHFVEGIVELTSAQDIGADDNYLYKRNLPGNFDSKLADRMYAVAETGIRALGMSSVPAHVELIYNGSDAKIVEIGARIGGYRPRMYKYSYGINLNTAELMLALGKQPELVGNFQAYTATYELFPETTGKFLGISNVEADEFAYFREMKQPGEIVGPAKNGFKAAAIIIIAEKNESEFKSKCSRVEQLKVVVEQ